MEPQKLLPIDWSDEMTQFSIRHFTFIGQAVAFVSVGYWTDILTAPNPDIIAYQLWGAYVVCGVLFGLATMFIGHTITLEGHTGSPFAHLCNWLFVFPVLSPMSAVMMTLWMFCVGVMVAFEIIQPRFDALFAKEE